MSQGLEARGRVPLALASIEKCIFQGGKTCKIGTKFTIRDIAQHVGDHAEKQCVHLRKTQGRDIYIYPERKSVGKPSNEEEHNKEAVKSFI